MSAMQGALSAAERSMRSVFVGNIPYEATEEQLKDIFAEVGPVVSFRLVYDRETGKPKGYGFCEYKDQEMALSAMRNLNSYELNGRALRVDNAASEKSKEELKNLQASLGGPPVESPYGPDVGSEKAPEAISKIMCSLPPEQLYELMIQMKMCIENNPNEARNLLIQNPQLSYALLQAQVIMKMVEPEVALTMLHRPGFQPPPPGALLPTPDTKTAPVPTTAPPTTINETPASYPSAMPPAPVGSMQQNSMMPTPRLTQPVVPLTRPALLGERPALIPERPPLVAPNPINQNSFPERARFPQPRMPTGPQQNRWTAPDPRVLGDHDLRPIPMTDRDMRAPPTLGGDKDMRQSGSDQDLRAMGATGAVPENRSFDPRFRNMPAPDTQAVQGGRPGPDMRPMQGPDMRPMQGPDMRPMQGPDMRPMQGQEMRPMQGQDMRPMQGQDMRPMSGPDMRPMQGPDMRSQQGPDVRNMSGLNPYDGRTAPTTSVRIEDQRVPGPLGSSTLSGPRAPQNPRIAAVSGGSPAIGSGSPNTTSSPRPANPLAAAAAAIAPHDQEKAALIMQVLQLSDQQIAMLPPEQRQSIMILKQQIARSQQI